jgi:hypothetical protein
VVDVCVKWVESSGSNQVGGILYGPASAAAEFSVAQVAEDNIQQEEVSAGET